MYLKRLELHGFKSFAHKTVLDFDPGMTAVVGPNGSGKSNVADALRWVMGEQSLKLLRGKKSEDVIFAGSDKKSKLSMAEVALTFDNKDHKMPLEYAEVVISRRLYRNGESEYLINNQRARLLDIVDALLASGFGATNYAVIGQGTIDQMVMAGPAEIKSLVEEASGVKPYYIKRDKTHRRLAQTEENLSSVSALLNEIEPRLRSLKRQAKRMEERETVVNELLNLQLQSFGHKFRILDSDLDPLNQQIIIKGKNINDLEKEIFDFQKSLEKEELLNKSSSDFSYELSKKINLLEQKKYNLQESLAEVRGKLKADIVPGSLDVKSLSVEKLDLERQISNIKLRQRELSASLAKDEIAYQSLKTKLGGLSKQIVDAKDGKLDHFELKKLINEFENEFNNLVDQLSSINFQETKQKLKQLLQKFSASKETLSTYSPDLSNLTLNKDEILKELHVLELRMVEQKTLLSTYSEQVESGATKLNQIKSLLKDNPQSFKSELFKQESELSTQLSDIAKQLEELQSSLSKLEIDEKNKKNFLVTEEKKFREKNNQLNHLKDEQNKIYIEKARLETKLEGLNKEAREVLSHRFDEVFNYKNIEITQNLEIKISKLKRQLELTGSIDEAVLSEYRETEERFNYLFSQSKDLSKAVLDLQSVIVELDQIIKLQFDEAFNKISTKFSEYFRILFNGGKAQMNLLRAEVKKQEDETEEESGEEETDTRQKEIAGIEIKATPPGKKLASITALSGGERALTAIALLCSFLASYPSPFVVLDEVDAALDEANSVRFAKILGTLAHQTQFITITHNRETMRQAHTLYGVTMSDEGISKILSLKLEKAESLVE
ncbi:MAG: AAA family ATPase [bacterium]|nr:AAA family ATPase [bacterium]